MNLLGYITQTVYVTALITFVCGLLPEAGRQKIQEQHGGDPDPADQFEKHLLTMFGLTRRPRPTGNKAIPRIMSHLYRAHMGDDSDGPHGLDTDTWEPGFDLPHDDILKSVNTARGFHHIETEEYLEGMSENHIRLKFDLSTLPKNERLEVAELLLHRQEIEKHLPLDQDHLHRINVYEVVKPQDDPVDFERDDGNHASVMELVRRRRNKFKHPHSRRQPIKRLLDTRLIDARNTTWERFDVSMATKKWISHRNHGLIVEVVTADSNSNLLEGSVKKHVRLRRDASESPAKKRDFEHERPMLLAYLNDETGNREKNNLSRRRRKRSGEKRNKRKRRMKKNCQKKDLYVDFTEVNWDDWIVAPHGYKAYFCHGDCPFPLAEYLNATNHAIVQTLVNSVNAAAVPKPCCVPTNLTPISMLYLDEYELVVLKTYQDMVVDTCGCR